ncbi:MAG TPA: phosphatidylglycerophosphatase A [Candidatus Acidoferrales bacterium]|nr:phosphatidylglycerophosphatase A [Candidatus Acidoferrales bacterium]
MSASTEPSSNVAVSPARGPDQAGHRGRAPKPRLALFVASAGGLGYIPIAPGTFGSVAGLALVALPLLAPIRATRMRGPFGVAEIAVGNPRIDTILLLYFLVAVVTAAMGVWSAGRAARFWQRKDPQQVVIDEVSGQHLAVVLGVAAPLWRKPAQMVWENSGAVARIAFDSLLSWKYLLVGFILFRVFDIWKPFPARQAESLPGGWGIMADDWVAGVYAAIGLWIVRAAGF